VRLPEELQAVLGGVETPVGAVGERADREVGDRSAGRDEVPPVSGVGISGRRVNEAIPAVGERVGVLHAQDRKQPCPVRSRLRSNRLARRLVHRPPIDPPPGKVGAFRASFTTSYHST